MPNRNIQDVQQLAAEFLRSNEGRNEVAEASTGSSYTVNPLRTTARDGNEAATTLWVHCYVEWHWDFFSYQSDCYAWVTDAQSGGNAVAVDKITAHISHDQCYGSGADTQHNSPNAHSFTRINGIAVCKSGVSGRGCAEHTGYGSWCTNTVHA